MNGTEPERRYHHVLNHTNIEAVKAAWNKGEHSREDEVHLQNLRDLYSISEGEDREITKRVKKSMGLPDETAVIAVIDDDPTIRKYVEHILAKTYKTVLTFESAEQAVPHLQSVSPSLVLCDLNLGHGLMSGFTFYEKTVAGAYGDNLKSVPFV